jgi:hypothetical protein
MVRTPEESSGFPMSKHHPKCEDFRQIEFIRVLDGDDGSFIDTKENALSYIEEESEYTHGGAVMLTQDQFDSLPEYQP